MRAYLPVRLATSTRAVLVAALLVAGLLLSACADMAIQPAFQRQQPPLLNVPAASVPVTAAKVWTQEAAVAATNPLSGTQASQAGWRLYERNCQMCHGADLKGTGPVGAYFKPPPMDLTGPAVQQASDGVIFWALTNGFGRMPAFGNRLTDTERWQLVSYLRAIR
jgi:mono/diheme cytochrome c family protein